MISDAKQRIARLEKEIERHRHLYHTNDSPEISDEAYDSLVAELEELSGGKSEILHKVGGDTVEAFSKKQHKYKQWSYNNVFNIDELKDWEDRNLKILEKESYSGALTYVCELKIDGLKCVLEYNNGLLVSALTRGDGSVGEEVLHNVKTIKSVPKSTKVKDNFYVVGEVWMENTELDRINAQREKEGLPLYANTRNLSAGTLRQLDSSISESRDLKMFTYDVLGVPMSSQSEKLDFLKYNGFLVNEHFKVVKNLNEAQIYYDKWSKDRNSLSYQIDGIVVKVNETEIFDLLGYTAKAPRGGIAFKLEAEQVTTTVKDIIVQVGRTGAVTPVAVLSPVLLAGSTVSRATLHNFDQIKRLDVRVDDTVILHKAGDVIPEIVSVVIGLRDDNREPYVFPSTCPSCNTPLVNKLGKDEKTVAFYCVNPDCIAKHQERLVHFVSRKAMSIEGLGPKQLDVLRDASIVDSFASIYEITKEDLLSLPRFAEKSATNIIESINKSKDVSFEKFLFALGVNHVGEETAKLIADKFDNLQSLRKTSLEELSEIYGVGEVVARSLFDYLNSESGNRELDDLIKYINIVKEEKEKGTKLSGLTFVITGTFDMEREQIKELITKNGGKVSSGVSSKTNYLIRGEGGGGKAGDAVAHGVKIISFSEFENLLK